MLRTTFNKLKKPGTLRLPERSEVMAGTDERSVLAGASPKEADPAMSQEPGKQIKPTKG